MPGIDVNVDVFKTPLTWIVVARQAPIYLRENPTDRAWMTFVLERETDLVLGQDITLTGSLDKVIGLVREALARPMAGPKRRPARLMVEERALVPLLGEAFGIPVEVADGPIPEADAFIEVMRQFLLTGGGEGLDPDPDDRGEPSYFDFGLPESLVRELVRTGAALAKLRPWDIFPNQALIRLDIPELGVREACVCIIGHMGESRSVLVFRSHDDYMVHLGRGERLAQQSEFSVNPIEPGIPILALDFNEAADFPARMRSEAEAMGLKPGIKALYPNILCMDKDGVRRPAAEPDLRLIVALATALARTFRRKGRRPGDPDAWPIREEILVPGSGVTRLTVPFEAGVFFEGNEAPVIPGGVTPRRPGGGEVSGAGDRGRRSD